MFITLDRTARAWLLGFLGVLAVLAVARLSLFLGRPVPALPASTAAAVIREGPGEARQVALTFDVIEGDRIPLQVLDVLRWRHARATFFVSGPWARAHPGLVRRMAEEGHQVETRGEQPGPPVEGPPAALAAQLQRSAAALRDLTGQPIRFFRPPAGAAGPAVVEAARQAGLQVVLWTLDAQDWMNPGTDYVVDRVARHARPGSIILLHASDFARQTPRALPGILEALAASGLRPVALGELLGGEGGTGPGPVPAPGPVPVPAPGGTGSNR